MSPTHKSIFLIIGAGPAGLGAARHLLDVGEEDFVILEASETPGGLASSCRDTNGFTWDLGSHLLFSHYERFDQCLEAAFPSDEWIEHERSTWIWTCGCFVPYPFQLNLHRLPAVEKWDCVRGLLDASRHDQQGADNFRDWVLATFGRGVARHFMLPYNEKMWARPLERMSSKWIGERVAVPELEQVLRSVCLEEDSPAWGPNATFRYPRRGGIGAVWKTLANTLPAERVQYGERVVRVDAERRCVWTEGGQSHGYEYLINTMPVDRLSSMLESTHPIRQASALARTSTHVNGVGVEGDCPETLQDKLWIYYPDSSVPFYRVTVISNLSSENTPRPGKTWSLMAEISESQFRPLSAGDLVQNVIGGFQSVGLLSSGDRIISRWHRKVSHGYPVPTLQRDSILSEVLPLLRESDIYSRGRFGAWKYEVGNQDHSFMQGVEAVEYILHGHREMTIENTDLVNSRRNPFPYHPEWSSE